MWDFTKAFFSFSWAMSLFGMQQIANLVTPSKGATAFRDMAQFTEAGLNKELRTAFRAGDNLQKSILDRTQDRFTKKKHDCSHAGIHGDTVAVPPPSDNACCQAPPAAPNQQAQAFPVKPESPKQQSPTTEIGWGPMPEKDDETTPVTVVGWGPMPT